MAEHRQFVPGSLVARFRLIPQGEQSFVATRVRAGPGYGQDLIDTHVGPLSRPRRLREGAVMADVAAQFRQRDKDLGGVGNHPAVTLVTQLRGARHQLPYIITRPGQDFINI